MRRSSPPPAPCGPDLIGRSWSPGASSPRCPPHSPRNRPAAPPMSRARESATIPRPTAGPSTPGSSPSPRTAAAVPVTPPEGDATLQRSRLTGRLGQRRPEPRRDLADGGAVGDPAGRAAIHHAEHDVRAGRSMGGGRAGPTWSRRSTGPSRSDRHASATLRALTVLSDRSLFALPPGFQNFHPRFVYDSLHGRWVGTEVSWICDDDGAGPNILLGFLDFIVSETADPTGLWSSFWFFTYDALPDVPAAGASTDKLAFTTDVYAFAAGGTLHGRRGLRIGDRPTHRLGRCPGARRRQRHHRRIEYSFTMTRPPRSTSRCTAARTSHSRSRRRPPTIHLVARHEGWRSPCRVSSTPDRRQRRGRLDRLRLRERPQHGQCGPGRASSTRRLPSNPTGRR